MRQAVHNMLTIAVALYGQPEPTNTEPAELYVRMQAYRRIGRYVATGK